MTEKVFLRYPQLTIEELSKCRLLLLRVKRIDQSQREGLEVILGTNLPEKPNTCVSGVDETLWLGPGQWLICSTDAERNIAAQIEDACRGGLFHLADVTPAFCVVEIHGRRSGDLIAKGCSLDLHPTVFRLGEAKRSLLGQVRVLLHRISASRYRIYFDVSLRHHVVAWLKVSAGEFHQDPVIEDDTQSQDFARRDDIFQYRRQQVTTAEV
jgi:sarcosine oxidase subunit gamma